ncbi:coenzyme F390 synthetase [Mycolicibacterium chubuense NBB4]|uniref:Coenzyme F390 synthetase n=1 Tax=Mycolicibacterium chubuense (strain NBB4) TaxID=710421 RepID=I4BG64_MYCCN|nr:phenylacetate--CoA ligase family protein [Mycolicibacterium chubuense]AFM16271.1 coenzyme F390 synthetase [Mycolicibacterium chubuense NBB4]
MRGRRLAHLAVVWDMYGTRREGTGGVARRQNRRLRDVVAYARTHSSYYRDLYREVPQDFSDVEQLPVVTKADLMDHFDRWVTDPSVTRTRVETFLADPANLGVDFLGRYVACTTSGATGVPAILVHDHRALFVYNVLGYVRALPPALSSTRHIGAVLRPRVRLAAVFVTGGPFLGNTMMARRLRKLPWRSATQRLFSALTPLDELVDALNDFDPAVLGGYPSALDALAGERRAGRLRIHPVVVNAAGETLTPPVRQRISAAFDCHVTNYYGSSEAIGLTYECGAQNLHVNSDWHILEPVDEDNRPVAAGQLSDGVLVTNLANRIQPIIRYQMGDRVAIQPESCPCGSAFPWIRVVGRTDDVLTFAGAQGRGIRILPLAIASVAEETPGVAICQLIQRGPSELHVRLGVRPGSSEPVVWAELHRRLQGFLADHAIMTVRITKSDDAPALHPRSGKFRQVYRDFTDVTQHEREYDSAARRR